MSRAKENWYFLGTIFILALFLGRPSAVVSKPAVDVVVDLSGFVLILIGLLIRTVSRDWKSNHGNDNLVTDGPYEIVRNPMYLGSLFTGSGLCFIFGSLPFLLVFIAVFLISHQLIVRREEKYLRKHYPEKFEDYIRETPAWFPTITGFGRLISCSFLWIQSVPRAILREKNAIGGNLVGACLLEAIADSIALGWASSQSEVIFWLIVALFLSLIWLVGGKMLQAHAGPAT
ncbi:MAG: isoprenylcysteine carboxylmethyltransferase family protein [Lentisphaerae bacterium]|nr:isoprenylcysteine carboxylmethyltransferase family protein [Lentisphaerota bacterium]